MADKTITCKDCNSEFIFSESEQAFYKEKGFNNEPQRCSGCRQARKNQKRTSGFNTGYASSGHRMSSGNRSFSSRW